MRGGRRAKTHLEVDGRHVSQLPGQRDALQDHVSALTWVNVQLHEHAVQVLGLEHADQGTAEQLSTTQRDTEQMVQTVSQQPQHTHIPHRGEAPGSPASRTTRPRQVQWQSSDAAAARSNSVPPSWTGQRGGSGTPGRNITTHTWRQIHVERAHLFYKH